MKSKNIRVAIENIEEAIKRMKLNSINTDTLKATVKDLEDMYQHYFDIELKEYEAKYKNIFAGRKGPLWK